MSKEFASKGVVVVGGTIDQTGTAALEAFVTRFHPEFPIGAMDGNRIPEFGDWGDKRTFVPQLYFIDKTGVIRAQFHGSDPIFEGDQKENLRKMITGMFLSGGATTPAKAAPAPKPGIVVKK
jgi:hypothetical protein